MDIRKAEELSKLEAASESFDVEIQNVWSLSEHLTLDHTAYVPNNKCV